jgi:hypothetical protein
LAEIPEVFNQPGAGFVYLLDGVKYPPIEREWQKKPHTFAEAAAHKGNVGVLPGNGYIGLDKDDPAAFDGLELPPTTLWETRPGRLGLWLCNSDNVAESLAAIGKKADQAQLKLFKDGKAVGEVKLERTYQVIPPSWKKLEDGTRADYKMLESIPPATISLAKLLADLQAIGITFEKKQKASRLEANAAKLESIDKKANQKRIESDEARTRRYAVAALRDEVLILASTPEGSRNEQLNRSAFVMGQFVAAKVLSVDEVISELSKAAENTGLELEEIRKTVLSGLEAGAQHPREIPPKGIGPKVAPVDLLERIKADPRALKDSVVLEALAALKAHDPLEYDLLLNDIKSAAKGIRVATINEMVDKCIMESEKATEGPGIASNILTEANQILNEGRGFEYAYQVWQRRHHGDENLGKGFFLSIGAQSCSSSKGVHVHACGPRGSGKSDGAEKASEAMPKSHLLVGSASPKALYYLGEQLPAGAVVYLDDIGWNDQAAQMFKTCTTFYKEGATHTVVVDQEIRQFKTAPRIIFWLTTADDQTDEQIRDRLLRIDTTETAKHTKEVIDFIFQQRKSGAASFETREIEVCRAIIHLLKQVFVDVVIPFSDSIRFEGDPRGATIFADLVSSFAIWRHRKRAHDSSGAVIAAYEDYKDAEIFFNAIKGHGDTKYTPRELRVLQAIKDLHGEATREMVMAKTGLSKGDLADILNGRSRDGQAKYGLLHKCPALTEEDESTQRQIDEDTKTSHRKKVYRLPEDYDTMNAYGKAVYLSDETTIKRQCSSSSVEFGNGSEIKKEYGKDIVRKFVEYKIIRERRTHEPKHPLSLVDGETFSLAHRAKCVELLNLEPHASDLPFRTEARTDPNLVRTKPIDSDSSLPNSSDEDIALLRRICGRMKKTGKPIKAFELALLMKANDHDIGVARCEAWLAGEAPA